MSVAVQNGANMEELTEIIKRLEIPYDLDEVNYQFVNEFKNPHKLPINQIHLERKIFRLKPDAKIDFFDETEPAENFYEKKTEVIPALDPSWVDFTPPHYHFDPHNLNNYVKTLKYLIKCNYHQFWCLILFKSEVTISLRSFFENCLLPEQNLLKDDQLVLYKTVYLLFQLVYSRLINCKESETEYMDVRTNYNYLTERKLINLPIVITLNLLYENTHKSFVNYVTDLYMKEENEKIRTKEIEELLNQNIITLEMISGYICGFDDDTPIVPLSIPERPKVFNIDWIYSIVNYLLHNVQTLRVLLQCFGCVSCPLALKKQLSNKISSYYDRIYTNLYEMLNERKEVADNVDISVEIYKQIALGRAQFIQIFNLFINYLLNQALEAMGNTTKQEDIVEVYLNLLISALEDEYFICDYNEINPIASHNEMFSSCTNLDTTRTDYIINCVESLPRHRKLWQALHLDEKILRQTIERYSPDKTCLKKLFALPKIEIEEGACAVFNNHEEKNAEAKEDEIEDKIRFIVDMFPHLGDGFVLQCLKEYNYKTDAVISAILEENLPPHLYEMPFDMIRIPPEPKPPSPVLAYKGKRPDYDDALKLLNDKSDIKQIKTFIMDGIEFRNDDLYDDEYDDRVDVETIPVPEYGGDDVLKYNPNYGDDVVSDTSYSENEYDDKGEMVKPQTTTNRANFCEDPAVLRERREARYKQQREWRNRKMPAGATSNKSDVVGKPKGQGQEKDVLRNRQKKSVNKSTRANHNRKGGAQWKRNKGMIPS